LLPSPTSGTCGSSQNIEVIVKDTLGNQAPNGTMVNVTTTFGYISSPIYTTWGIATAQFVLPLEARATAQITVSALGSTAQRSFAVLCDSNDYGPGATASQPSVASPAAGAQNVQMRNFAYTPAALTVQAGQPVTLNVANSGPAPHTFTIAGVVDSGSVASGTSKTVQFSVAQPGSLTFFCTIHGASVMSGTLTVTPAGAAQTGSAQPMAPSAPSAAPAAAPMGGGGGY